MICLLHAHPTGEIGGVRLGDDTAYLAGEAPLKARGDTLMASYAGQAWDDVVADVTTWPYPPPDSWAGIDFGDDPAFDTAAEILALFFPDATQLDPDADPEPPAPSPEGEQ